MLRVLVYSFNAAEYILVYYREETQRKILEHIEECMTDLVAQLDEDDALLASSNPNSSDDPYLSLVGLQSIGNDKCGYER